MEKAIIASIYSNGLYGYIARKIIKTTKSIGAIQMDNINIIYDEEIHKKEVKINDVKQLLFITHPRYAFYVPGKKIDILLLSIPDFNSMLILKGCDNVFTYNRQLADDIVLKFGINIKLLKPPTIKLNENIKSTLKNKTFKILVLGNNVNDINFVLKEVKNQDDIEIITITDNVQSLYKQVQIIKQKLSSHVPLFVLDGFTTKNLSQAVKSSHLIYDTTGFFAGISTQRAFVYTSTPKDFREQLDKTYRKYISNQLLKEDIILSGMEIEDAL